MANGQRGWRAYVICTQLANNIQKQLRVSFKESNKQAWRKMAERSHWELNTCTHSAHQNSWCDPRRGFPSFWRGVFVRSQLIWYVWMFFHWRCLNTISGQTILSHSCLNCEPLFLNPKVHKSHHFYLSLQGCSGKICKTARFLKLCVESFFAVYGPGSLCHF